MREWTETWRTDCIFEVSRRRTRFSLPRLNLVYRAQRAVVVEDAIAGVQAGRAGRFGLVIGVARKGEGAALMDNGADVVVTDLSELAQDA